MGIWKEAYVIKIYSGRSDNDKKNLESSSLLLSRHFCFYRFCRMIRVMMPTATPRSISRQVMADVMVEAIDSLL